MLAALNGAIGFVAGEHYCSTKVCKRSELEGRRKQNTGNFFNNVQLGRESATPICFLYGCLAGGPVHYCQ
eukprot:12397793-Karenia_brevis.AAC.1